MDKALGKSLTDELKSIGAEVAVRAKAKAPVRTGALRASIKPSVTRGTVSIYSNLPYAPVHEFGGSISPNGTRIRITESRYMQDAVDEASDDVEERLGDLVDNAARRYAGFH